MEESPFAAEAPVEGMSASDSSASTSPSERAPAGRERFRPPLDPRRRRFLLAASPSGCDPLPVSPADCELLVDDEGLFVDSEIFRRDPDALEPSPAGSRAGVGSDTGVSDMGEFPSHMALAAANTIDGAPGRRGSRVAPFSVISCWILLTRPSWRGGSNTAISSDGRTDRGAVASSA